MALETKRWRCVVVRTRAKKIPAEERRNVTVEAVIDLAGSTNPDSITTAAIAEHMHLTQGAIFRHFPNKDAIWTAVITWVSKTLMARIERAAKDAETPLEKMESMFMAHVSFVADHPGVPRMLFGELQNARKTPAKSLAQNMMKQYAARLGELIAAGKACKELRPDLDEGAAATLFVGTIQGLVMQSLIAGDMGQMQLDAPRVFAIYLRGISMPHDIKA
ncbi:TetR/AcrR family transcriptional regulator [Antarcticimicrobium sediminis]|uniref:TetR/AcrR family transcriptional regulator n=1 Tax=Antarcticimicrobium sediminis TaxID=2546227 RepID=UPI001FE00182|nr:TetR/AcrR family transcriptional regulator [Antarcticimicrobium sediminis]